MAVTSGTILSVSTLLSDNRSTGLLAVLVLFDISGTYAQADDSTIAAVGAAISASRRNGKTCTLVDACLYQPALTTTGYILGAKSLAISTDAINFALTKSASLNTLDVSTEHADATAVPALGTPFGFFVTFTES